MKNDLKKNIVYNLTIQPTGTGRSRASTIVWLQMYGWMMKNIYDEKLDTP